MTKPRPRVDPVDLEKVISIHEAICRDLTEAEAQLRHAEGVYADLKLMREVLLKYMPAIAEEGK